MESSVEFTSGGIREYRYSLHSVRYRSMATPYGSGVAVEQLNPLHALNISTEVECIHLSQTYITVHQWKIQLESIPSVYSTFAAELIQPTFRQLTFSLLPYCSMGDYAEAMVEVRTGDVLANANEQF